jgi:hypothetical protein
MTPIPIIGPVIHIVYVGYAQERLGPAIGSDRSLAD